MCRLVLAVSYSRALHRFLLSLCQDLPLPISGSLLTWACTAGRTSWKQTYVLEITLALLFTTRLLKIERSPYLKSKNSLAFFVGAKNDFHGHVRF